MRDQIYNLGKKGILASAINSDQTSEHNEEIFQKAKEGNCKILFIAPEQLDHIDRFQILLNLNIDLIVIDEAHCISTWGHDFRPSYRQILTFTKALLTKNPNTKVLALTATANERVEIDICKQIFIDQEPEVFRHSMNRPNISLSVIQVQGVAAKLSLCEELLAKWEGCGLIYCATRENTELVAEYFQHKGLNVTSYHAGYETSTKCELQEAFIHDKYKALVATNALGMGIDKSNLRFIIHFDFPGSITAYYQEVGRCGRDGKPAHGAILFDPIDQNIHDYFIHSSLPSPHDFENIQTAIRGAKDPLGLRAIKTATGLHPTRVTLVIAELLEQGYISKESIKGKQVYQPLSKETPPDLSRYKIQKEVKLQELKQIKYYAEQTDKCRMLILRHYLGDEDGDECQSCDICLKQIREDHPQKTLSAISEWLDFRVATIAPMAREKLSAGFSVLDGNLRSQLFIHFMQNRSQDKIDETLFELLSAHLSKYMQSTPIAGIIPLPSRTWKGRDPFSKKIGDQFNIPLFDLLSWEQIPEKRQGELLNNDQRHDNVHKKITATLPSSLPKGALLLFDDYIGSGNTLKEAARALRSAKVPNDLIPITIASLKWRLGKPGFVQ